MAQKSYEIRSVMSCYHWTVALLRHLTAEIMDDI